MVKFENLVGGAIVLLVINIGGYCVYRQSQRGKIQEKLAESMHVDIPEKLIRDTVEKEVRNAVSRATAWVEYETKRDICSQVRSAVNKQTDDLKAPIAKALLKQVGGIDKDTIRKEALKKAQSKFDDKLDDILDDLKDKFDDVDLGDVVDAVLDKKRSKTEYTIKLF